MKSKVNSVTIKRLRSYAAVAEKQGQLHGEQLKIIYRQKWFKLFVPKEYGGLQLDLPSALQLEEQLAWIDGSVGWTITLCAGANFFAGFIPAKKATKIFSAKKTCLGGSGAIEGIATETKNGFAIKGFWKYATGAPHLTHFTANCRIEKNKKTVKDRYGKPLILSFYFHKKDVRVHKDWTTMGLAATASHSFSVDKLKVASDNSFVIDAAHAVLNDPIYKYPFLRFAENTLAVNTLGMSRHFFEEALAIIKKRFREKKITQQQFNLSMRHTQKAQDEITELRQRFYFLIDASWKQHLQTGKITKSNLSRQSILSKRMVKTCQQYVAAVYLLCGLTAADTNTTINRIYRDIFTASQHKLLSF